MNRLLLIEDEEVILKALTRFLERNHFEVTTAMTVESAIDAQPQTFDLILADLRLPGAEGTDIIPIADTVPVVIMTSHASVRSAVNAMRSGASDYIAKPFDHDELLITIERSLMQNRLLAQNRTLKEDLRRALRPDTLSINKALKQVFDRIVSESPSGQFLAIHGPRGSGKEQLARALHAQGKRAEAPLVVADLTLMEPAKMETALLGGDSVEGSHNIAPQGLLHAAHNGTLIIRCPVLLPLNVQRSLAQAVRIGSLSCGISDKAINVHLLAINDHPLTQLCTAGKFDPAWSELFLNNDYGVPALCDQPAEPIKIARCALQHFCGRHHLQPLQFSESSIAAIQAYRWPGNLAELINCVERAVLICAKNTVEPADLGLGVLANNASGLERDLNLDEYFRYFVLRYQSMLSETELASRLGISRKALWERRQKIQLLRQSAAS